jgi:cell division protein FtsW (lipid II flippase)
LARWRCSSCFLTFGRGPAGNDAKVNLGPFQPVEVIKILLVLFLAGYFTRNWERLRDLRERRALRLVPPHRPAAPGARGPRSPAPSRLPSFMFFVLKDLGPALVTIFLFLSMFGVARGRPGLALAVACGDGGERHRGLSHGPAAHGC